MQIIKRKYKKNLLNILFSTTFLLGFCYVILAADKYTVQQKTYGVNAAFLELKQKTNSDGYISLDNVIIFNSSNDDNFTYIVQPGDTLASVAAKFGSTVETLKKTNSLKKNTLKSGDKLIISQQDGIVYEMDTPMTIKDFAKKYNLSLADLMELNYISDENYVFEKDEEVFVPISEQDAKKLGLYKQVDQVVIKEEIIPAPKPKTVPNVKKPSKKGSVLNKPLSNIAANTNASSDDDGNSDTTVGRWYYNPNIQNGFARGYCTRYVAIKKFPYISSSQQKRIWGGNARSWYSNAKAAGYSVGHAPRAGAIIVMSYGGRSRGYGHVGIVKLVDSKNNRVLIEDMNAAGKFIVTSRRVSMNSKIIGYIYM